MGCASAVPVLRCRESAVQTYSELKIKIQAHKRLKELNLLAIKFAG